MHASVKPSRNSLSTPSNSMPFNSMNDMLEYNAQQFADKTAVAFLRNGETLQTQLTYRQLQQNAQRLAAFIQQYANQGSRVVLMLSPGLDYISSFFACLYAGCVAVPTYPPANRRRDGAKLDALLQDANPRIILTSNKEYQRLCETLKDSPWQTKILNLDEAKNIDSQQYHQPTDINPQTLAFLQYTSGSTGSPKGVMVSHQNLIANITAINTALKTNSQSNCVTWLPPYHDMGLIGTILACTFAGASIYIMEPVAFLQQPYRWLKAISDYKATHTAAPNFAYQLAIEKTSTEQLATLDLSSWQIALSGAEPIRYQTLRDFEAYFAKANYQAAHTYPAYGLAEFTLFATGGQVTALCLDSEKLAQGVVSITDANQNPQSSEKRKTIVSCGHIGLNSEMAIVNPETIQACEPQAIGEIWLRGPSKAQGYWQKPQLSAQTFQAQINQPMSKDNSPQQSGWLRTGDLGFIHDKQLYVTGRIKDLIIIRGRNLYPQDIEQCAVRAHDDLLNDGCAAFSIEDEATQKLILIHEVSRRGVKKLDLDQTAQQIRRLVHQQFAVTIDDIVFIRPASLARTSSGKIQHSKTKTNYVEQQLSLVTRKTAHTSIETDQFIQRLTQHIGVARGAINAHTAFADLGLDSLAIIELTSKLSSSLNRQIDPMLMWDYPTIGQFCDQLNGKINTNCGQQPVDCSTSLTPATQHIAVIGMAVHLPKNINSLTSFWQAMMQGQTIISPMPANRLSDWRSTCTPEPQENTNTGEIPIGGFVEQVDKFDANFFAISAKDAVCIDPQQRLLLQTSWQALEDASLNRDNIRQSNTGIFIGLSTDDYGHLAKANPLFASDAGALGLGNARSIAAGRIAYFLGCHGPAMAVDTACSSSAYAIHLACQSLKNGESTLALAGGANLILQPQSYQVLQSLNALSPSHQCRTFSQNADGYVRGEGSAMVVLATEQYAVQHQHRIYATIGATHVNQDGHSNGLTAPNGGAQRTLLRSTLQKAKLPIDNIGFIETHGTGTPLGDPIEVNAIADVYDQQPVVLGAIKSQFGHLEAAAGVLALIKTALAISKQQLPANLGFDQGNQHIKWQQHHIRPVNKNQPWPAGQSAGINAFGLSGTNVSMIVKPAPSKNHQSMDKKSKNSAIWPIVKISAQSKNAAFNQAQSFKHILRANQDDPQVINALISASQYRSDFDWRASFELDKRVLAKGEIDELDPTPVFSAGDTQHIVFMFTGQGAIYSQMGRELYRCAPVFAKRIEDASTWLSDYLNEKVDLAAIIFDEQYQDKLQQPRFTQLSLYVLQIALVDWLASLSITPKAVIGHSIGEFAAAYCAGVIDAQTGYKIVYTRGLLTEQCPAGAMLAVKSGSQTLIASVDPTDFNLDIAAINAPQQTVLSGAKDDIHRYQQALTHTNIEHRLLDTTHGFHSQLMTHMATEFATQIEQHQFAQPSIDWFSTLNGMNIKGSVHDKNNTAVSSEYWSQHLRKSVLFHQAFNNLKNHFADNLAQVDFIEIGPKPILSALVSTSISTKQLFSTLKTPNTDQQQLSKTLARLWQKGHNINWQGLTPLSPAEQHASMQHPKHTQSCELSSYAFDQKRFWLPDTPSSTKSSSQNRSETIDSTSNNSDSLSYQNLWQTVSLDDSKQATPSIMIADEQHQKLIATINPSLIINPHAISDLSNNTLSNNQQLSGNEQLIWCFSSTDTSQQGNNALVILKNLMALNIKRLWIIVEDLHTNSATSQSINSAAILWGACKSIHHEYPQKFAAIIDIDAQHTQSEHTQSEQYEIIGHLLNQLSPAPAYRLAQQGLMVEQLCAIKVNPQQPQSSHQDLPSHFAEQHFLITGGNGALGKTLCRYLLDQGASKITLASRKTTASGLVDNTTKIQRICLDVCDAKQVKQYFAELKSSNETLDGIFHLAGIAADVCPLQSLDGIQTNRVLGPKTHGAWHLHQYSLELNLKHFVLFSSIASLLGYAGQTAYSAANYHLDWLANYRRQQGLPALSINWGPWQGDGMAANDLVNKAMSQMGVNTLAEQPALSQMQLLLQQDQSVATANVAIIDVKSKVISQYNNRHLAQVSTQNALNTNHKNIRANEIEPWLEQVFGDTLGEPLENEQKTLPLNRLGMDSIRALDIKHAIFERTGLDLPVVQFLQGLSFAKLCTQIAAQVTNQQTGANRLINTKAPNPAPLSDPQQRLWLVNQWQQPNGLYNIHAAIRLTGKLNIARWQAVMDALSQRHEVLRSLFINNNKQGPQQRVLSALDIVVNQHQFDHDFDMPCHQSLLHHFLRQLAHQVFDLSQGPLWSVDIITNPHNPNSHILALTLDHIITDAWSMDVLISDVMALYRQQIAEQLAEQNQAHAPVQLAPLDIQYKDYALWQQQDLTEQKLARLGQYWQQTLADFTPFELTPDKPRPERQDLSGRCHRFSITSDCSIALTKLAAEQGVTLYVLLLTLFKLYMHQQTGSRDIAIGTDVANREQAQTRNMIGFFVNLLVLRSQWLGNPSFTQLLQQQAATVQQALEHQDMPFHRLVELLNRPRDASKSPLVQVLFVLQNAQSQSLQLPDVDIQSIDFDQQVCRFDMALFFHQKDQALHGHWHYATALYQPERIAKLAQGFNTFINHIIAAHRTHKPLLLEDIRMLQTPFKSTKSKAGFNRFKSQSMLKKPLVNKPLVEKKTFKAGVAMPLVLKATNNDIDPFAWVALNREQLFADLQQHGALLFRDFGLKNAQDFERFAQSICPSLYGDYGDLPKEKQGEKIYHSTPYPKDKAILYHNESSHLHQWPTRQFFFCVKPSAIGGATPIVDCREVYRQMDKDILAQFENKHLKYVRNFSRNLDVSWQNFFKTQSRSEVETKCKNAGIQFQWLNDDGLRTEEFRRAVTVHPQSGQKSFFNQIQLHHSAFLPAQVRESLLAIGGVENLPRHVYFGDGSEISDEIALYTLDLYERLAVRFEWQQGDLVMVDNMAVAHARDPFEGERKINVAMAEMQNQQGEITIANEASQSNAIELPAGHYNNLISK